MPLMLTPAERAMLDGLAAPVSAERRTRIPRRRLSEARGRRAGCDRGRQHPSRGAQRHRRLLVCPA